MNITIDQVRSAAEREWLIRAFALEGIDAATGLSLSESYGQQELPEVWWIDTLPTTWEEYRA